MSSVSCETASVFPSYWPPSSSYSDTASPSMLCCRVSTIHCFFHSLCLLQNSPLPCTRASAQLTAVSTSRLLLMPCRIVLFASTPCLLSGLALCDECFTHYFFSDVGQHLFGALPEEARPVYVCSDADKSDSLCRRDFFYVELAVRTCLRHFGRSSPITS